MMLGEGEYAETADDTDHYCLHSGFTSDGDWVARRHDDDWYLDSIIRLEVLQEPVLSWKRLPAALLPIQLSIEASRSMLELEDDWDGEGSEGYAEATWRLAVEFLAEHALRLWDYSGIRMPPPHIDGAGSGSVDLHWKTNRFELLINIRKDGSASLYGDNYKGLVIKGPVDPQDVSPGLIAWFVQTS